MSTTTKVLLVLVLLLAAELVLWQARHRTTEELELDAREGPVAERVFALHALVHRGEPRPFTQKELTALLTSPEPLLREYGMTAKFSAGEGAALQESVLREQAPTRAMLFFFRFREMRVNQKALTAYLAGE